jgi:mannitol-specific phosphotransferase system IIBC component
MAERTMPDIGQIERDGFLILPAGWASSFEHRLAAMVAYILDLPVTYASGRAVHRDRLMRGMLGR